MKTNSDKLIVSYRGLVHVWDIPAPAEEPLVEKVRELIQYWDLNFESISCPVAVALHMSKLIDSIREDLELEGGEGESKDESITDPKEIEIPEADVKAMEECICPQKGCPVHPD